MKKRKWPWILGIGLILLFVSSSGDSSLISSSIILAGILLVLWKLFGSGKNKKRSKEIPELSDDLKVHYTEVGMTPSEINFFRETMNHTKTQINRLQVNLNQTAKLKAIDLRHDTVKAAKALFKELVKEPHRLHDASHFLYTHLPNLIDLTDKYIEINNHEIKNKQTYAKLEESAQIIDQVASLIAQDYQQFVSDDLDDLDLEISVAKQNLKRDNRREKD